METPLTIPLTLIMFAPRLKSIWQQMQLRQGMVLLKNRNSALPLKCEKFKKNAVVGPHAAATEAMIGNFLPIHQAMQNGRG